MFEMISFLIYVFLAFLAGKHIYQQFTCIFQLHCKKKRKFCKKFPSHIKDQSLGLKGSLDPFNVREESLNGKGINWASLKSKGSFQSRGLYFLREVSRDKNKGNIPGPGNNPLCIRAKSREVYN